MVQTAQGPPCVDFDEYVVRNNMSMLDWAPRTYGDMEEGHLPTDPGMAMVRMFSEATTMRRILDQNRRQDMLSDPAPAPGTETPPVRKGKGKGKGKGRDPPAPEEQPVPVIYDGD